jgi:hypothetical protein
VELIKGVEFFDVSFNVFVYDFVVFGTKIAKREEDAGNPLGFPN